MLCCKVSSCLLLSILLNIKFVGMAFSEGIHVINCVSSLAWLVVVFQTTDDQVKKRKKTNEQGAKSNNKVSNSCC